jgi:hypothetical protein
MFKKINKPNRKTSKGIDTIFSVLSLPLRVITGPGLMLLPPQTKLIVVLVMMILLIIAVILFGVAFAQIGSRPFSPTTTLAKPYPMVPRFSLCLTSTSFLSLMVITIPTRAGGCVVLHLRL